MKVHTASNKDADKFKRLTRKTVASGVDVVHGTIDNQVKVKCYYFHAGMFTPGDAKKWLKANKVHGFIFEEAK